MFPTTTAKPGQNKPPVSLEKAVLGQRMEELEEAERRQGLAGGRSGKTISQEEHGMSGSETTESPAYQANGCLGKQGLASSGPS